MSCTGFPVKAKGITPTSNDQPAPANSAKTVAKAVTAPVVPIVTPDKARSAVASVTAPAKDKTAPKVTSSSITSSDKTKSAVAKTSDKPSTLASSKTTSKGSLASSNRHSSDSNRPAGPQRLARVTAYWAGEGDYYTGKCLSSTGIHLHNGHCAVDPRIIPYGSVVSISGVGTYVAVDTGSAVISREAAREAAHTPEQRNALVIDLFFESRRDGERFANSGPKYAAISWTSPMATSTAASVPESHTMIADGLLSPDGNKL
jgi:3D (Asp-Asp-Asp) domain-containing protein